MTTLTLGYFTASSREEAETLLQTLCERRLVACGLILEGATSFFWWKENLVRVQEVMVWIKTSASHQQNIEHYLTTHHSYEMPFITFWESQVSPPIAQWITETLGHQKKL